MNLTFSLKIRMTILAICFVGFNLFGQLQIGDDINGVSAGDQCGGSVSISMDGKILAIGSEQFGNGRGQVRIFCWKMENWIQLGEDITGEDSSDGFGGAMSLSENGSRIAIGAEGAGPGFLAGQVKVYEWDGLAWIQLGSDINGTVDFKRFGENIGFSNDGNVIAISSGNDDDSGLVRIFKYDGAAWEQMGEDIVGESENDRSGRITISADGSVVAIGADGDDGNGEDSGHVRIFEFNVGSWIQKGEEILGAAPDDRFGGRLSIAADGDRIAIGGIFNDSNGEDSGHVIIYNWNGNNWEQIGQELVGEEAGDVFGRSISISSDGNTLAVGASGNDGNGLSSGHVRLFGYVNNEWEQLGEDIDGEAESDFSGTAISLSSDGNTVAIGALLNDGNGEGAGHVRVFGNILVGINEHLLEEKFEIYPNPVADYLNIMAQQEIKIQLFSPQGVLVFKDLTQNTIILNLTSLNSGMYILIIEDDEKITSRKIIKI